MKSAFCPTTGAAFHLFRDQPGYCQYSRITGIEVMKSNSTGFIPIELPMFGRAKGSPRDVLGAATRQTVAVSMVAGDDSIATGAMRAMKSES